MWIGETQFHSPDPPLNQPHDSGQLDGKLSLLISKVGM